MPVLTAIPTNVISGFLGVGKSTAILHLLKQKPANERWAVLVNEFGEVGIDGSMLDGQHGEASDIFVREVAGGCMCCAAGLPMQIALSMLLARAKPHRLLIEPTGLGHPKEVLATLAAEHYREVLDMRASITLIDARKVHEERYTSHPTFIQQLSVADIIVANKADQYRAEDFAALLGFLEDSISLDNKSVFQVTQGALQLDWLQLAIGQHDFGHVHDNSSDAATIPALPGIPEKGYLSIENEGEGFYSRGWIFDPGWVFDEHRLCTLLHSVAAERIKGVFITQHGISAFNKADDVLTQSHLDDSADSRIECITSDKASLQAMEDALIDCVIVPDQHSKAQ